MPDSSSTSAVLKRSLDPVANPGRALRVRSCRLDYALGVEYDVFARISELMRLVN